MELSTYNNEWFSKQIGASKVKQALWYCTNVVFFINPLNPLSKLKVWLLRVFGAEIGTGVTIKPGVNIKYPWKLKVGDHCWIGENVWIDNLSEVTMAGNVCISQGAMLLTGNHDYTKITFDLMVKPIVLKNGAWVGAKAIVCPGVTMGENAVLTVQSVAVKDLEPSGIYQGNPALLVKKRVIV
ncbi:MAG: WcaF family extracellular polysaccharide biosynthesis acetyltransferase [Chitinophagaceae bacterium]